MENQTIQMQELSQLKDISSTKDLVKLLYRDDSGKPFELTPTQNLIFDTIFYRQAPDGRRRVHIMTSTQFGKSTTVALAVLTAASSIGGKWVVLAPSQAKARIITSHIIQHCFDNEYTMSKLKLDTGESVEHLRRERSKNRLTFQVGNNSIGEVFILTTEGRLRTGEDIGNALMGYGAPHIIMDEAGLIDDNAEAKAMRMVAGFTTTNEDFVVKIGNPFKRNHFLKSFQDNNYFKIKADWRVGVQEGRLTQRYIEERKGTPFFDILWNCEFPAEDAIDSKGWQQFISEKEVERAMVKESEEPPPHVGEVRLGTDPARGGGCQTVWAKRSMNYAEITGKSDQGNLSDIATRTAFYIKENKVNPKNVFIDEIGVGGGVVDPLHRQNIPVRAINVAYDALDNRKFLNSRAENYWRLREWIFKGGKLSKDDAWYELSKLKWKVNESSGRIQMMSKDQMRGRGIDSPDSADALMLTFARPEHVELANIRDIKRRKKERRHIFNRGALHVSQGGY